MFGRRVKILLANHRRNVLVRKLDYYMVELHRAYENSNYDFRENGEQDVLEAIRNHLTVRTAFDVGANIGEWTNLASDIFLNARIFSFEIIENTYRDLVARCGGKANVLLNNVGLSDRPGEIEMYCARGASVLATTVKDIIESFHGLQTDHSRCGVTSGDLFCAENRIDTIDFLKIDVEGMEDRVLMGFSGLLGAGAIKIIQFEYGYINVVTKFLLKDFYDFLRPRDMVIGKIYPSYVEFRDYKLEHEDFIGPNFLAVHSSLTNVIEALQDGRNER
jgi:FkbM family methyltransferase